MIPIIIVVTSALWYVSITSLLFVLVLVMVLLLLLLLLVVFSYVLCSIRFRGIFNNRQKSNTYLCPVAIPHTWNTNLATSSRGIVWYDYIVDALFVVFAGITCILDIKIKQREQHRSQSASAHRLFSLSLFFFLLLLQPLTLWFNTMLPSSSSCYY